MHPMEVQCSTSGRLDSGRCIHGGAMSITRPARVATPSVYSSYPKRRHAPAKLAAAALTTRSAISAAATATTSAAEDKWIAHAVDAIVPSAPPAQLASVHSACLSALSTMRMPTTKNEEYRYTDVAPLLKRAVCAPSEASPEAVSAAVALHSLKRNPAATIVIVDGVIDATHSSTATATLPAGVYIGSVSNAPKDIVSFSLGAQSRGRGGPFTALNGAAAKDAAVIHIPANITVEGPIHILYLSSATPSSNPKAASSEVPLPSSAPRLLVVLEEGSSAELIEEFAPLDATSDAAYMCTAVTEIELDDRSELKHSYVEVEGTGAAHLKATLVNQGRESKYSMVEARIGGAFTRHDIGIEQLGDSTETIMRSFLLAGQNQLHDLHSKLKMDHPEGRAEQLHKCISAHATARGVFDGNVQVNRLAQRTDAQQLSRNLLLVPRATVNVKPNLQIIADDVKCTHGCTVSDLEDEELFYLRARGIDTATARQMLVYSFGREVVQGLCGGDEALLGRVEGAVREVLDSCVRVAGGWNIE